MAERTGSGIDPSMSWRALEDHGESPVPSARRMGASYLEVAELSDGTPVVLRPIRPGDGPLLQACFQQLSDRTRYLRFHSPRAEFSPDELRSFTGADGET